MTDVMQGLVHEAKRSKFSTIGPLLSDSDVISVWDNVSAFIDKQMSQQKGVTVPGLGTFTFTQKKLDVGNNKHILIQRPVFLLSEKFAQTHGVTYTKYHSSGRIPVVTLNFAALSYETPFDRDTVEGCVKEVLGALTRSVSARRNVEFTFCGIGRLQIRDTRAKMKFYKEFINAMDGSGKLVDSMKDRPGTVDSVMSERCPSRPNTGNTLHLPRIIQDGGVINQEMTETSRQLTMPAIQEDEEEEAKDFQDEDEEEDRNEEALNELEEEQENGAREEEPCVNKPGSRVAVSVAMASGVNFTDDLLPAVCESPKGWRGSAAPKSSPTPLLLKKRILSPLNDGPRPATSPVQRDVDMHDHPRSRSVDYVNLEKPCVQFDKTPSPPRTAGSCGHPNAGQELCYLCHQRARRNIPVSFAEERRQRQEEEDCMLQQYQHIKDAEDILKKQSTLLEKRHDNQKMAAFNLGVAEAIKYRKGVRSSDFSPSYIFQKRPLTPPRFIKQDRYHNDLEGQIKMREEAARKHRADEEFLERLEQVQLAEDLAAQRDEYLKGKADQQEQYKRALSAQIRTREALRSSQSHTGKQLSPLTLPSPKTLRPFSQPDTVPLAKISSSMKKPLRFKPTPISGKEPDSQEPVFGRNDLNAEKMIQRKKLAYDTMKEQLDTVAQRKRDVILKRLSEQKEEELMLERTKKELLEDRAERFKKMYERRRQLECDWAETSRNKYQRSSDEKVEASLPGLLLHEQCDRYHRCAQCKRRMLNCGESNIWRDSRYIPGSRLMV